MRSSFDTVNIFQRRCRSRRQNDDHLLLNQNRERRQNDDTLLDTKITTNVELKMTSFVKYESNLGRIAIDCNPFHVSRRVSLLLKSVCSLTSAILRRSNTTSCRSQQESMEKGHYNSYTEVCFGYFGRSSSNSDSIFSRRSCF